MSSSSKTEKQNGVLKSGDWSGGDGLLPGRETLGPLALMIVTPPFVFVYEYICRVHAGQVGAFVTEIMAVIQESLDKNDLSLIQDAIWRNTPTPWNPMVWTVMLSFMALQLVFMKFLPGKDFHATMTPTGHVPVYKANGVLAYSCTIGLFLILTYAELIYPAWIYLHFAELLASLNVFALVLCFFLVIKGHLAPSTRDSGTNGSAVVDFYWGMELYPRIFDWDIKMFTNCRVGLIFWALGPLCFAHYNMMEQQTGALQLRMAVNVALQLVYCTKFFYWEMGYMCSMDIQHDRAGYYLCWGCLVWVPCVYTSSSFYLASTSHLDDISPITALLIFLGGLTCIWINYESDHQRYVFRQTHGKCTIWGRVPKHIVAQYTTTTTTTTDKSSPVVQVKKSLLLLDGFWKVSRHFHYMPEILASVFWTMPSLLTSPLAYFYCIFLTLLLLDRAFRDDDRCRKKYGSYWDEYCAQVPYMIVPGIV